MSTTSLAHPGPGVAAGLRETTRAPAATAPGALAAALIAAIVYAAFAHGAVSSPAEPRLQVGLAAIAALAAAAWLWTGTLRLAAPRLAIAGVALLAGFAVWSGISLLWSIAPDETWIELNRTISYVLVLGLALALGASHPRAVRTIAVGFWAVALVVSCYGVGQKLLPGLHVAGVINLDQTGELPRLQEPFGYWNALALFIAMGVPAALAIAADESRTRRMRVAGVVSLELMFLAIGSTYSRGGVLALVVGATAGIALSGAWLRSVMWLAAAALATAPPLVFALTNHSLTSTGVGLGSREGAGGVLAAILAASVLVLVLAARRLLEFEDTVYIGPDERRRIARSLLALAGVVVVAVLLAAGLSSRGFGGTISHAWKTFTATRTTSNYDPSRLLSADSENRWVWWKEAAGAIRDRPLQGWGAGSFPVLHLLYRKDTLSVREPHSVPLQWLAETGVIGAVLAIGGLGLLLVVAVRGARHRPRGSDRLLLAALTAGAVAYAVHAVYDWDWDIPGVTLPALVFLGVIAGSLAGPRRVDPALPGPGRGARALALAAATLGLCSYALSAVLPSIAASKARSALVTASGTSGAALDSAHNAAALAAALDPVSDAGLTAEATIAARRGDVELARSYVLDAVARNPSDGNAWAQLADLELLAGYMTAARRAANRALALDPRGQRSTGLAVETLQRLNVLAAPPQDSATATPLPPPRRPAAR
ncbi:MAG TPA: O-antigen ligase family protein [Solirubrobacteraceae bacterium]|nr:O-antigen ligase family protein [Solirubrobacteraceae bacterium]